MNHPIRNTTQIRVPIIEYDGAPLSLTDQFPIGYLAGATVKDAIIHDPKLVSDSLETRKVFLKGDAIHFLMEHTYRLKRRGNKKCGF